MSVSWCCPSASTVTDERGGGGGNPGLQRATVPAIDRVMRYPHPVIVFEGFEDFGRSVGGAVVDDDQVPAALPDEGDELGHGGG